MQVDRDVRVKRMTYRSWHRGCKETDIILGFFADNQLPHVSDAELDIYEAFLDEEDADIWKWLTGEWQPENADFIPLLEKLRGYNVFASAQASA
jgi:antitoxin CptB